MWHWLPVGHWFSYGPRQLAIKNNFWKCLTVHFVLDKLSADCRFIQLNSSPVYIQARRLQGRQTNTKAIWNQTKLNGATLWCSVNKRKAHTPTVFDWTNPKLGCSKRKVAACSGHENKSEPGLQRNSAFVFLAAVCYVYSLWSKKWQTGPPDGLKHPDLPSTLASWGDKVVTLPLSLAICFLQ